MSTDTSIPSRTVAVIDVGTTSIRMQIAEVGSFGVRTLEMLSQAVDLGRDTFSSGEISRRTIEVCVRILRDYRDKLREYHIIRPEDVRIVATSAVREATNRLAFIDRIYVATGLSVEPIDVAEVHRVTYRSIQPLLRAQRTLSQAMSLIVEVSGGSTELLMLDQGNVAFTQTLRLGVLRLQQTISTFQVARSRLRKVLEAEIQSLLEPVAELLPQGRQMNLVAVGSDMRLAARELLGQAPEADTLAEIPLAELAQLVDRAFALSEEELVEEFQISFAEAATLGPSLLVYQKLAELIQSDRLLVSAANLRDGLIREMGEGRAWSDDFHRQIIRSAWELARKYHVDEDHAGHVADLSRTLFRELQPEHQMEARDETLLYVAALLHEAGGFINQSSIHKHSMYIIMNSELFGLTADEVQLVALVTRYHRRALPKPSHPVYSTLDRERRVLVSKLAVLLRIAIALDASRAQRIQRIECLRIRNRLILSVPDVDDVAVEQLALPSARSFFESVFGRQLLLRTQTQAEASQPSSQL